MNSSTKKKTVEKKRRWGKVENRFRFGNGRRIACIKERVTVLKGAKEVEGKKKIYPLVLNMEVVSGFGHIDSSMMRIKAETE